MNKEAQTLSPPTPFQPATQSARRLKLLVWGDSGTGKTTLALSFGRPVVLDLEGGTDLYGEKFSFDRLRTTSADEAMAAVDWLRTNDHTYETLVIDPISIYWEALQHKWSEIFLRRNKGGKGYKFEYYDFQMRDWGVIKSEWRAFIRKLIALDMNVIVTARQKVQYAEGGLRPIGDTFDGEKSLPYLFDSVVRLHRDEKGRFLAQCLKDRSGKLPMEAFPTSYSTFEKCFGLSGESQSPRVETSKEKRPDGPGAVDSTSEITGG